MRQGAPRRCMPGGGPMGRQESWIPKSDCVATGLCRPTATVRAGVPETSPGPGCSAFRAAQHECTIVKHGEGGLTDQLAFRGPLHRFCNEIPLPVTLQGEVSL